MASLSVVDGQAHMPVGKAVASISEVEMNLDTHTSDSEPSVPYSRYLTVSPYTEQDHLLDLDTLDTENQILAEALVVMKPMRDDYATGSYLESFNWAEVMHRARRLTVARGHDFKRTSWYIVAFRSQIKPTTEYPDLGMLDKAAHAEATASGGFLKYWFGTPNQDLRNLATCIWTSQEHATKGSVGPDHRKAVMATRSLYSEWKIDQHRLILHDGAESWEIVNWRD